MGGLGSGNYYRWGSKQTLDDCRFLDINLMVKLGAIREYTHKAGSWLWTYKEKREEVSRIEYECNTLDKDNSYLRLYYKFINTNHSVDYKVRLVRTYPRYGGVRFWFICPEKGKRVGKLFLTLNDGRFVSRHVYRIHYASQTKGDVDRAIDKKWKLMEKVGGYDFPLRPKGMHQKTFDRIEDRFYAQDSLCLRMIAQRVGVFNHTG